MISGDHDVDQVREMTDDEVALQIKVPKTLKRAIQKAAFEDDETMKTFILQALRDRGLKVPSVLLGDGRTRRPR